MQARHIAHKLTSYCIIARIIIIIIIIIVEQLHAHSAAAYKQNLTASADC